jgi:hypothetical protein
VFPLAAIAATSHCLTLRVIELRSCSYQQRLSQVSRIHEVSSSFTRGLSSRIPRRKITSTKTFWDFICTGGMKEGEDNWVDMQVPDGTDWVEYMLKVSDNASHKTLGVMNHLAIGVNDIEAAAYAAQKGGILGDRRTEDRARR